MKNTILLLLFMLISSVCFSQTEEDNYSQDEGKVTEFEMTMKEYPKDPDAEAVVIYELGNNYFVGEDNRGFVLYMEKRIKIKILKQAGLGYADFEIPYYVKGADSEYVEDIKATTYNYQDGKLTRTELQSSKIYEEKISDLWRSKKFAMPDVREGSVVEVSYKISTPYFINMRQWDFQKKIPVVYSKLDYRAIPYYEYVYIMRGNNKFDIYDSKVLLREQHFGRLSYKEVQYSFGMKDIPAFKDEEFISSPKSYMISLDFQLSKYHSPYGGTEEYMSTWPKMCDEFLKDDSFGKYIKNSEKEAKKILQTLDLEGKTQGEKAKAISEYVKSGYNWNSFASKRTSQKVSELIKTKTGNSADINLFLIGLLKAADIKAEPVLLSTRGNGVVNKNYPFQQFLNYVIAKVELDSSSYFVDATESLLAYNDLPRRCINVEGLVVKPKSEEWVITAQNDVSLVDRSFNIKVMPAQNQMQIEAQFTTLGGDAYLYRSEYLNKKENLNDYLLKKKKINQTGDIEIQNYLELDKPFIFSFQFNYPVENTGEKIFIQPFANQSIADNPFKQTKRIYPIDMVYISSDRYKSVIEIPEGYKVEYLPPQIAMNSKMVKVDYSAIEKDGKIEVEAELRFKSNIYSAESYIPLKASIAGVIKRFSEMIVLVKQ